MILTWNIFSLAVQLERLIVNRQSAEFHCLQFVAVWLRYLCISSTKIKCIVLYEYSYFGFKIQRLTRITTYKPTKKLQQQNQLYPILHGSHNERKWQLNGNKYHSNSKRQRSDLLRSLIESHKQIEENINQHQNKAVYFIRRKQRPCNLAKPRGHFFGACAKKQQQPHDRVISTTSLQLLSIRDLLCHFLSFCLSHIHNRWKFSMLKSLQTNINKQLINWNLSVLLSPRARYSLFEFDYIMKWAWKKYNAFFKHSNSKFI